MAILVKQKIKPVCGFITTKAEAYGHTTQTGAHIKCSKNKPGRYKTQPASVSGSKQSTADRFFSD